MYSTLCLNDRVTKHPRKVRDFNVVAEAIRKNKKIPNPKLEAIRQFVISGFSREDCKEFNYKLEDGYLLMINDSSFFAEHQDVMLSRMLLEFADKPIVLEFISEDFNKFGYYIVPNDGIYDLYYTPFYFKDGKIKFIEEV